MGVTTGAGSTSRLSQILRILVRVRRCTSVSVLLGTVVRGHGKRQGSSYLVVGLWCVFITFLLYSNLSLPQQTETLPFYSLAYRFRPIRTAHSLRMKPWSADYLGTSRRTLHGFYVAMLMAYFTVRYFHGTRFRLRYFELLSCLLFLSLHSNTCFNSFMSERDFTCVAPCQGQWKKPGPFNRHQRTCKHWLAYEDRMQKRRAEHNAAAPRSKKRKVGSSRKVCIFIGCSLEHCLIYSEANSRLDPSMAPTDMMDPTVEPDIWMPGKYPDEGQPPTEATDTPATSMAPAIPLRRTRRAPVRFRDVLPEPPQAVPPSILQPQRPAVYLIVTNPFKTLSNSFGLFRQYLFHPSHDPDAFIDPSDLSNITTPTPPPLPSTLGEAKHDPPWPFTNMSIWRLMRWVNTGSSSKSEGEVDRLVKDVINAPDFQAEDLRNFNTHRQHHHLDTSNKASPLQDNFKVSSITIEVPAGRLGDQSTPRTYSIPGLHYRKLLNVIKAAFQDPLSRQFHLTPFALMHRSPITNQEQRVYGELYNSDEFINEHKRVQNRSPPPPDNPGCKLEKVVAALMFWSDSTHLTNFGTAALWPIYLFFGNLSKYIRSQPSSGASHHLAYIPSVCILNFARNFSTHMSTASRFIRKLDFRMASTLGHPTKPTHGPLPTRAHPSCMEVPSRR